MNRQSHIKLLLRQYSSFLKEQNFTFFSKLSLFASFLYFIVFVFLPEVNRAKYKVSQVVAPHLNQ